MNDWRPLLAKLVGSSGTTEYPLCVFDFSPPSNKAWPKKLPTCQALKDFYKLCDGGTLSLQYTFHSLVEVESETKRWVEELQLQPDGIEAPLVTGRHAVVATDSGGALVVWDADRKRLRTLYWQGGGWEEAEWEVEKFLEALFFDPASVKADDLWAEAVQQLRG